jgi:hypothetical protein
MDGNVVCTACGATYAIVAGPGYLTIQPVSVSTPIVSEADYLLGSAAPQPGRSMPVPSLPAVETRSQADLARIADLQRGINDKQWLLGERRGRRHGGTILLLVALAVVIFIIYGATHYILNDTSGPIVSILTLLTFLIGLILRLASGKGRDRKIQKEIDELNAELTRLNQTPGGQA